ncbi:MAG TPA: hypothetical protein ENK35_12215 [Candidatus Tenderia sp.]|nr:hypothetical protein [Candidatus Tenderia sp.]
MNKTAPLWIIIAILSAIIVVAGYKFIAAGSTAAAEDGRTAVLLSKAERQSVLTEMRTLLEATQQVVKGLAENDMNAVIAAATPVSSKGHGTVDFKLAAKLPLGFKKLGFATHHAFDDIVSMAQAGQPRDEIQLKLVEIMDKCVACHASFQLPEAKE